MKAVHPDRKFLTKAELASRWSIPVKTIQNRLYKGELPFATKLGGHWRFALDLVEKHEDENRISKPNPKP